MEYSSKYILLKQVQSNGAFQDIFNPTADGSSLQQLVSKLNICNTDSSATYFSLGYVKRGDSGALTKQYIEKNVYIEGYSTSAHASNSYVIAIDIGVTPGDYLFLESQNTNLAINIFGIDK